MEDTCHMKVFQRFVSMGNGHMLVDHIGTTMTALSFVGNS